MADSPLDFSNSDVAELVAPIAETPPRKGKRKDAVDSDKKMAKAKPSPKRKTSAVKAGNQRHKPSSKKSSQQCRSCGKVSDHTCFAVNQLNASSARKL